MARGKMSILIYTLIGLAVIGMVSQLFTNTVNFFTSIFITLGIGIAIFAVFYFVFLRKKTSSNDMQKYKKAVKQSKAKYKQPKETHQTATANKQHAQIKRKVNKRAPHLRVIDGNKHKKKDRASF
ncbi:SA1362 family protein [Virgibacillus natechei]|uniref:SA1362 family protein n=1 Tax=Virgibacillus sp. CBA3643 TaxID=2942278 RepID=UPI0035A35BBC